MTIKRTSKIVQKKFLHDNSNLKILDLGCSNENYWKEANHFADIFDYQDFFKNKSLTFTKIDIGKKLPFSDKEFDYVILSHVLEHVEDIVKFKSELERVAKSGYIELPTKLADNLVFDFVEEKYAHKWWLEFDDSSQTLLYSRKINPIQGFLSVGSLNKLVNYYEDSLTIQLYWQENIEIKQRNKYIENKKISFFDLQRKFYGYKIRSIKSKIKNLFKV